MIRKGPDSLPASWFLFYATLVASLFMSMLVTAVIVPGPDQRHDLTLLLAVMSMVYYFIVLQLAGVPGRFLQSLTAIFGTDFLFTAAYLLGYFVLSAVIGEQVARTIVGLVFYWSIAVQGHIIARAIGRHWFIGIGIAMIGYIMLLLTYWQLTTTA